MFSSAHGKVGSTRVSSKISTLLVVKTLINLFCFAVNVQLKQMLQTNSELDYATNIVVVKVGHRQLFITQLPLVTIAEPPFRRISIPTNTEETEYP